MPRFTLTSDGRRARLASSLSAAWLVSVVLGCTTPEEQVAPEHHVARAMPVPVLSPAPRDDLDLGHLDMPPALKRVAAPCDSPAIARHWSAVQASRAVRRWAAERDEMEVPPGGTPAADPVAAWLPSLPDLAANGRKRDAIRACEERRGATCDDDIELEVEGYCHAGALEDAGGVTVVRTIYVHLPEITNYAQVASVAIFRGHRPAEGLVGTGHALDFDGDGVVEFVGWKSLTRVSTVDGVTLRRRPSSR